MSLARILLGFLAAPASGYALKKAFEGSVKLFWDADLSQIYPTLHKLRREGLVEMTVEASDRGPRRKVYRRTARGSAALRDWLDAPAAPRRVRDEQLAQMFFLGQADDWQITAERVALLESELRERLDGLERIDAEHRRARADYPDALPIEDAHMYFVLRAGIVALRAKLDWCRETREHVERRLEAPARVDRRDEVQQP